MPRAWRHETSHNIYKSHASPLKLTRPIKCTDRSRWITMIWNNAPAHERNQLTFDDLDAQNSSAVVHFRSVPCRPSGRSRDDVEYKIIATPCGKLAASRLGPEQPVDWKRRRQCCLNVHLAVRSPEFYTLSRSISSRLVSTAPAHRTGASISMPRPQTVAQPSFICRQCPARRPPPALVVRSALLVAVLCSETDTDTSFVAFHHSDRCWHRRPPITDRRRRD